MNRDALLRFAPLVHTEAFLHPETVRPESVLYQRGALRPLLPGRTVPVLVDHDEDRQVGVVRELFEAQDVTAGRVAPWLFASVTFTDPPEWLRRDGGVSLGYKILDRQECGGWTRILRAILDEVSVLTPATMPANPCARVAWVGEAEPAGDVIVHAPGGDRARRLYDVEPQVIQHAPGPVLRRHNIGSVIGVR